MWPFSTLKHLRWEIEQANTANEMMRTALTRRDERLGEAQHALIMVKGSLLAEENKVRELKGQLVISEHATQGKGASIRQLNAQIAGMQSMNKALAAERDEAVLRARRLDEDLRSSRGMERVYFSACNDRDRMLVKMRDSLKGALIHNPKTGRLCKWVDPATPREQETARRNARIADGGSILDEGSEFSEESVIAKGHALLKKLADSGL